MIAPFKKFRKIAITTGDLDGVGFEVSAKALCLLPPSLKKNRALFFLFRHITQDVSASKYFRLLDRKYFRYTFTSLEDALLFINSVSNKKQIPDNILIDLCLNTNPAEWVRDASLACKAKSLTSLVTGPLSKNLTTKLSEKPLGHTGIFRHLFPNNNMHMLFIGKFFNVLLATDHINFESVEKKLVAGDFKKALKAALVYKKKILSRKKIAVLGLNPHAGENSLMGNFENKYLSSLNKSFFHGPLVPDAAFLKKNWSKYCLFLCMYHDQGLIPFKSHHGQDSGVHVTLGLPFVRTSVDHGTANDIFNKNIANETSMFEALKLNLKLTGAHNV